MALESWAVYGACTPSRKGVHDRMSFEHILGSSQLIMEAKRLAQFASRGDSSVLLLGESGCGKEVFARTIHYESKRGNHPFIAVNCAAIPDALMESELFGYVEGAFTGAVRGGKPGKFELANGGTIFLDEIGDMSMPLQAKMLRVLQERVVERVGDTKVIPVDVRVIAATNKDLLTLVERGRFRQDLFYRLDVISIKIPPLRERPEDIPAIANGLLQHLNRICGTHVQKIASDVLKIFAHYEWPGNIRELENVLEYALNFVEADEVKVCHLPPRFSQISQRVVPPRSGASSRKTLMEFLSEFERELIRDALKACGDNRVLAAKRLGISRSALYKKMAKYSME